MEFIIGNSKSKQDPILSKDNWIHSTFSTIKIHNKVPMGVIMMMNPSLINKIMVSTKKKTIEQHL